MDDYQEQFEALKKKTLQFIEEYNRIETDINNIESLLLNNIVQLTPEQRATLSHLLLLRVDMQETFKENMEEVNARIEKIRKILEG